MTDELFRASTPPVRRKYIELVEGVRSNGGTVYIFSALHVSGQQLNQVSGVAAILRYPLPDLDELELEYEAAMMAGENDEDDPSESSHESDGFERVREDLELMNF